MSRSTTPWRTREAISAYVERLLAGGGQVPVELHPTIATTVIVSPDAAA